MSSANSLSLEESKICRLGKGYKILDQLNPPFFLIAVGASNPEDSCPSTCRELTNNNNVCL